MVLTPNAIKKDIDGLISDLIEKGVCDDSNFSAIRPHGRMVDVTFSGSEHVSIALGDIEYAEIYRELADKRSFNMKLVDGALLQIMYRVEGAVLLQHRLAFYPSPSLLPFQDDPDAYMRDALRLFNAELFHFRYVLILMREKVFMSMLFIPKAILRWAM